MRYDPKDLLFDAAARERQLSGVKKIAQAVGSTMGAKGRKALIEREWDVKATLDGVSVAREISFEDKFENMGATLIKEAAEKTNEEAGDGTTTATVLTAELMKKGHELLAAGANGVLLARGMEAAKDNAITLLKSLAIPVKGEEDYRSIAFISSRDETIARIVADIMQKKGQKGVVTVEKANVLDIDPEFTEGMQFDSGYASYTFINNPAKMEAVMENAHILLYGGAISDVQDLIPVYKSIGENPALPAKTLLIVADDVTGSALATAHLNNTKQLFHTLIVKAPEWGEHRKEFLKDLAILTGGKFIDPDAGMHLKDTTYEDLGGARKVIASRERTQIIDGEGTKESVEGRIKELEDRKAAGFSEFEESKLNDRLARLTNGIVVIKVGAPTETAQQEKIDRVEDALGATRSAMEEGIVPGGGTSLIRVSALLGDPHPALHEDEQKGYRLVQKALLACTAQIAENAGQNGASVVERVKEKEQNVGYNVMTGEYEDLVEAQVIDPVKVQRCALENAVSIASLFLTSGVAISLKQKKEVPSVDL